MRDASDVCGGELDHNGEIKRFIFDRTYEWIFSFWIIYKEKMNYIEIILDCFHVILLKSRTICSLYLE